MLSEACGGAPAVGGARGAVDPFAVMVCWEMGAGLELPWYVVGVGARTTWARMSTTISRTPATKSRAVGTSTVFLTLLISMSNSIYLRVRHPDAPLVWQIVQTAGLCLNIADRKS